MQKILVFSLMFFIVFASIGYASGGTATASAYGIKEVKSLDRALTFQNNILANTNYSVLVYFNETTYHDGIDYILSAYVMIVHEKFGVPAQTWNFYINGTECDNSPITVSIGQSQYVGIACPFVFMNTSLGDVYNFTYRTDKVTNNVFLRIFTTYVNNPDFTNITEHYDTVDLIYAKVYQDDIISNHDYCVDNQTQRKQLTLFNNVTNTTSLRNIDTYCNYECNNNTGKCNFAPYQNWINQLIIIIIIIIIIAMLWWWTKR